MNGLEYLPQYQIKQSSMNLFAVFNRMLFEQELNKQIAFNIYLELPFEERLKLSFEKFVKLHNMFHLSCFIPNYFTSRFIKIDKHSLIKSRKIIKKAFKNTQNIVLTFPHSATTQMFIGSTHMLAKAKVLTIFQKNLLGKLVKFLIPNTEPVYIDPHNSLKGINFLKQKVKKYNEQGFKTLVHAAFDRPDIGRSKIMVNDKYLGLNSVLSGSPVSIAQKIDKNSKILPIMTFAQKKGYRRILCFETGKAIRVSNNYLNKEKIIENIAKQQKKWMTGSAERLAQVSHSVAHAWMVVNDNY